MIESIMSECIAKFIKMLTANKRREQREMRRCVIGRRSLVVRHSDRRRQSSRVSVPRMLEMYVSQSVSQSAKQMHLKEVQSYVGLLLNRKIDRVGPAGRYEQYEVSRENNS